MIRRLSIGENSAGLFVGRATGPRGGLRWRRGALRAVATGGLIWPSKFLKSCRDELPSDYSGSLEIGFWVSARVGSRDF